MNWYLLYTKPKCEDAVAYKLAEAGFEVLNPKLKERRHIRRKTRDVVAPLFPSYVFVRLDIYRSMRLVKYTRGVRKVIGTEDVPTIVPDEVIASIKTRIKDGIVEMSPKAFSPGERVSVESGPFEGLEAVFEQELTTNDRVSILLRSLNARVVIDPMLLKRVENG